MSAGRPDVEGDPVTAAIDAMKKAADALAKTVSTPAPDKADAAPVPSTPDNRAQPSTRYYQHLEQRGALKDVDDATDLATLSPEVTHVRYPDGRIRRVGYS